MSGRIRVVIVDDHALVRSGLRALLATEPDIEVVGEAADGSAVLTITAAVQPDIILMDLVMPVQDGITAIRQSVSMFPDVRILVLTSFASDEKIFPALKAGALGYLLKDSSPEDLVRAIRQVYHGESSLHPHIARKVLRELADPARHARIPEVLTERETAVLRLVARGLSNGQIADQLGISEPTVRTHMSNILSKLHLATRTQAALYALRTGIASLDEEAATD